MNAGRGSIRFAPLVLAVALAMSLPAVDTPFVSADSFIAAYRANELAADQKYKNKTLIIRGVIRRVAAIPEKDDPEADGSFMVCLGPLPKAVKEGEPPPPEDPGAIITCYFTRGKKSLLLKLKSGKILTVKGRCRGGGPILENCSL